MHTPCAGKRSGFTLFEFVVSMTVLLALSAVLWSRLAAYEVEAERLAVQRLVATLRTALHLRLAAQPGRAGVQALLDGNPLDLLQQKPTNYLGEFYAPELQKLPGGNWLFDRRDKCLVYLLTSHRSLSFSTSIFLKFKVEFEQPQLPRGKNGASEGTAGLMIKQIDGPPGVGQCGISA